MHALIRVLGTFLAFGALVWLGSHRLFHGPLAVYPPAAVSVVAAVGIPLILCAAGLLGVLRCSGGLKLAAGIALAAGLALLVVSAGILFFIMTPMPP